MNKLVPITMAGILIMTTLYILSQNPETSEFLRTTSTRSISFDEVEKNLTRTHSVYGSFKPYPRDLSITGPLFAKLIGEEHFSNGKFKYPSIYIKMTGRLGNNIVQLSNAIYFCEFMNISTIYIKYNFCWIKNPITTSKGIRIIPTRRVPKESLVLWRNIFFFDAEGYWPEDRVFEFASETLKALPEVNVNENDLYIHIRSGDIFRKWPSPKYGQPPLCFYESIIEKWGFKNVYLLIEDKKNPVINHLVKKYNAKLVRTSLTKTISYVLNSRNLVMSFGTFLSSLLKLQSNDSEKRIFRYGNSMTPMNDIWNRFYFTEASQFYWDSMLNLTWKNTKKQRDLMINEKCGDEWKISMYTNYSLSD